MTLQPMMTTTAKDHADGTQPAIPRRPVLTETFKGRRRVRSQVDMEASYSFSSKWYPCILRDLTTEGAGLKINQIFVPGDNIRVRFGPNDDDRVVAAKVSNVNGNRIGVRFFVERDVHDFLLAILRASI